MNLPSNAPRPPYLLAADKLRQEITSGHLKPGDRLPSSRELKETLGIANATVHAAIKVLRDEGLVYSVQGRGNYVARASTADGIGEFTVDYTAPAWYMTQGPGGTPAEVRGGAGGKAADPLTESLRSLRDQLQSITNEVGTLKQQMADLKNQVERLEQQAER